MTLQINRALTEAQIRHGIFKTKKLFISMAYAMMAALSGASVCTASDDTSLQPGAYAQAADQENISGKYKEAYEAAGYQATFTYISHDNAIEKVEVFSESNMQFYKELDVGDYILTGVQEVPIYSVYEYESGMSPCAGSTCYYELEEIDDGTYSTTLPLPAGQYLYQYRITYSEADGREPETVEDPANPSEHNGDSSSGWSTLSVGDATNAPKQLKATYPRKDEKIGTVTYVEYEAADGTTQPLGIYLPYGYSPKKSYKTLYLSHGSGGNETDWWGCGSAACIFDNLIAEDILEETIVVTMDNSIWYVPDVPWISGWDWEALTGNLSGHIIPYIEEHYNVSHNSQDRAFAGLSMGSIGASTIVQQNPDLFGYYGCFSAANNGIDISTWDTEQMKDAIIFVSAGELDIALMNSNYGNSEADNTSRSFTENLTKSDISHTFTTFPGMHDWNVWSASLACFAENILWK